MCPNEPKLPSSTSGGPVGFLPISPTPNDPPFLQGQTFQYFCIGNIFELSFGDGITTCQENHQFSLDATPPECLQKCKTNHKLLG